MAVYSVMRAARAVLVAIGLVSACGGGSDRTNATDGGTETGQTGPSVILDGGGNVPQPPDGQSLCAPGVCNYQTQAGCGPSESCLPTLSGSTVAPACSPAGSQQIGQACVNVGDCARGSFCVERICRKACCGSDWSACPNGQSCIRQLLIRVPGTNQELDAGMDLCFPVGTCDVFDPNSCPSGRSCQIVDPLGNVACGPPGTAALAEPCSSRELCIQGMSCVDGHCRRLCRAVEGGGEPACPSREGICVHYRRNPPGVGECTPVGSP